MDLLGTIWQAFWGTLLNILVTINAGLSQIIPNQAITVGLSIIIFTVLMRFLTVPLTMKALRSSRNMQQIQPIIKDVQRKYKDDRQKQQEELMKVYQQYGINPAAGCFPMLVQIPVFIGLYSALMFTLQLTTTSTDPNVIKTVQQHVAELGSILWVKDWAVYANFAQPFLWINNLAHPDNMFILPVLSGVFQFIQSRMSMPRRDPNNPMDSQTKMMQNLMQFMPIYIIFISWNFAAGAVLYWAFSSLFGAVQQYFITGFGSLPDFPGFAWLPRKPIEPPKPIAPLSDDQVARKQSRGVMNWMMEKAKAAQETQGAAATDDQATRQPKKGSAPSDGAEPASARARTSGSAASATGPTRPAKVVTRTNRYAAALKQSEAVTETGSVGGGTSSRQGRGTSRGSSGSAMRSQANGTDGIVASSAQLPRKSRSKR